MKRLITLFLLVTVLSGYGQEREMFDKLVGEGDRYYAREQYNLAIQWYRRAVQHEVSDPSVDYKLAECYRKTFDYPEAEVYYMKVFYTGQNTLPLSLYYYALMLKLNGNLPEAMERFDEFIALHQRNAALDDYVEQAIIEKAGCEIALEEFGVPSGLVAERLGGDVNTPYNDFAPAVRDSNTLVITSGRIASNRKLIDERNGEAFTDNYYFVRNGTQWEDRTRQNFYITNSPHHDGTGSFTRNGMEYFFTVCKERCLIYETHFDGSRWTKPAPLNEWINAPGSESKQPAISPGGDTLYFTSDRAGGYGKFDIWFSVDNGVNEWSKPMNAGRVINTRANDIAPAIADVPSTLFFASEGHPGYGGFDLFVATVRASGDTALYNLNLPFNSVRDDCFLAFRDREIYWSSNRDGGAGGFDLYYANHISAMGLVARLGLKNRNITLSSRTARAQNVHLLASRNEETIDYNDLSYERKMVVNRMVENRLNDVSNSRDQYPGLDQEEYDRLNEISHTRFQTLLLKQKYASSLLMEVTPGMDAEGPLSVTGQLIHSGTGLPMANARILLTNEYGEILKITGTNEEGNFRFTDVPPDGRLFLRLEQTPVSAGRQSGVNAFVKEMRILQSDKPNSLYVENVYFDFDHYLIRPEAAQVLSNLATYLKANPGAQVEIYAFADDRGSSAYNFELTQKRGEAVAAFLIRNGVDETGLAIIPKGKQKMRFATNEIQRQYNRRAEFYINGVREAFEPSVKTYILKREADWDQIAKITGVPVSELKLLNGSKTNTVKAYQPVRIPLQSAMVSDELFFVGI